MFLFNANSATRTVKWRSLRRPTREALKVKPPGRSFWLIGIHLTSQSPPVALDELLPAKSRLQVDSLRQCPRAGNRGDKKGAGNILSCSLIQRGSTTSYKGGLLTQLDLIVAPSNSAPHYLAQGCPLVLLRISPLKCSKTGEQRRDHSLVIGSLVELHGFANIKCESTSNSMLG